jgi:H2-forming N5,N10-methylenetetrahydromethanopterin dehydrogenase-like enzyme
MSQQLTIQVSDQVIRHASQVAAQTEMSLEEVIAALVETSVLERPVEALSNEEILALTELHLSPEQETSLGELLEQNRELRIDENGRSRLDELMRIYEQGLLRKSQALRIAVQRGLRQPLIP